MIRRLTSTLLLATSVAVQVLPGTAGAMACRMDRSAQDEACMRCAVDPAREAAPVLAAGSCCRFSAAPEIAKSSGVLVGGQRIAHQSAPALPASSAASAAGAHDLRVGSPEGLVRSSSPPLTSSTNLRL